MKTCDETVYSGDVKKRCVEPSCPSLADSRGYCLKHYKRHRKTGALKKIDPVAATESRIWSRVDKQGPVPDSRPELGPCWLWVGTVNAGGYGQVSFTSQCRLAHRVVYERTVGPIPDGLQLDHLCRVRRCVNPDHLEPVTNRENGIRGEGLPGQNVRKTHCPAGHPYDAENLSLYDRGGNARYCKTCGTERSKRYQQEERCGQRPVGTCPKCKVALRRPGRSYCGACCVLADAQASAKRWGRK